MGKVELLIMSGRRGRSRRIELVVLIDGYRHIPGASEAFGDDDQVTCPKFNALGGTLCVRLHLAFEQIAGLLCIKFERVLPRRTAPPTKQEEIIINSSQT